MSTSTASEKANTAKKAEKPQSNGQSLVAKDAKPEDLVIRSEGGDLVIREQVVGMVAALAIREVEGIAKLEPFGTSQAIEALAKRVGGGTKRDLGVRVEMGKVECAIDCRVVVHYGVSIPAVAAELRQIVAARVAEMTGLEVKEVNIEVLDLYFGDEQPEPEPEARARQLR